MHFFILNDVLLSMIKCDVPHCLTSLFIHINYIIYNIINRYWRYSVLIVSLNKEALSSGLSHVNFSKNPLWSQPCRTFHLAGIFANSYYYLKQHEFKIAPV